MRVAHVTATFPPYSGGTGNVAWHNAAELARRGHDVRVITAGTAGSPFADPPGVQVHRLPARFRIGNAPYLPALSGAIGDADLVHLHYPFYFGAEMVRRHCLERNLPYVVTYHHDVLFPFPMALAAALHHRVAGRRILAGASLVAATTLDYAASSRLACQPALSVSELPNGVDAARFTPEVDGSALRFQLGLDRDLPVVLFVGGLDRPHYFKGLRVLLEAMRSVPQAQLLIVGDGDQRSSFEAAAVPLGARVRFAGRAPEAALACCFALSDVAVLPSTTGGEAFGLVVLEAMATARPVVASRLPGVRAVLREGDTGFLVEPGNALELGRRLRQLLADPALRRRMGEAGRRLVLERYDWSRIGDRLEALYARALAAREPAGATSQRAESSSPC